MALWTWLRGGYAPEDFARFSEAFAMLLASTHDDAGLPRYEDVLGAVYMAGELGHDQAGQFFAPSHIPV